MLIIIGIVVLVAVAIAGAVFWKRHQEAAALDSRHYTSERALADTDEPTYTRRNAFVADDDDDFVPIDRVVAVQPAFEETTFDGIPDMYQAPLADPTPHWTDPSDYNQGQDIYCPPPSNDPAPSQDYCAPDPTPSSDWGSSGADNSGS